MNAQRRKSVRRAIDLLTDALDIMHEVHEEETDAYDNMPESLQYSERGETMADNIDRLDEILSTLEETIEEIDDLIA